MKEYGTDKDADKCSFKELKDFFDTTSFGLTDTETFQIHREFMALTLCLYSASLMNCVLSYVSVYAFMFAHAMCDWLALGAPNVVQGFSNMHFIDRIVHTEISSIHCSMCLTSVYQAHLHCSLVSLIYFSGPWHVEAGRDEGGHEQADRGAW